MTSLYYYLFSSQYLTMSQVKAMVQGHDRRPALGVILARKCRARLTYPPQV